MSNQRDANDHRNYIMSHDSVGNRNAHRLLPFSQGSNLSSTGGRYGDSVPSTVLSPLSTQSTTKEILIDICNQLRGIHAGLIEMKTGIEHAKSCIHKRNFNTEILSYMLLASIVSNKRNQHNLSYNVFFR